MFDPKAYGPEVARIFAEPDQARELITASKLSAPVRSALYLHFGFWKEAHEEVDDLSTQDACYWHAIVHRREPDPGNSGYWFRQVGEHPIFPALRKLDLGPVPFTNRNPKLEEAEWELLFDYCAK